MYLPSGNSSPITEARLRSSLEQSLKLNRNPCTTINVTYTGFTPQAQAAFQYAVDLWASIISSSVPITINANFAPAAAGNLGSAGPTALYQLSGSGVVEDRWYPIALAEKLIGEELDGNPSNDINCSFNSNRTDWYYGTDANPPSGQFDFVTVVLHELGHGLGFIGISGVTNGLGTIRTQGFPSIYSEYVQDLLDGSILNYADPSAVLAGVLTSGPLKCDAPLAVEANNGTKPRIFAPNPYQPGSSYSHWDLQNFPLNSALMRPSLVSNLAIHDPGPVTIAFFEDMGWSLCASLSTNEFKVSDIEIRPNPFNSDIDISLPITMNNSSLGIQITDINGRTVYNEIMQGLSRNLSISNLSNLKSALYFITVKDLVSGNSITKKIIKI